MREVAVRECDSFIIAFSVTSRSSWEEAQILYEVIGHLDPR